MVLEKLNEYAKVIDLDPNIHEGLKHPKRAVQCAAERDEYWGD
jgi:hypothetical protein